MTARHFARMTARIKTASMLVSHAPHAFTRARMYELQNKCIYMCIRAYAYVCVRPVRCVRYAGYERAVMCAVRFACVRSYLFFI